MFMCMLSHPEVQAPPERRPCCGGVGLMSDVDLLGQSQIKEAPLG